MFLTLLDDVAAGTGATPLAMPDGDELDRCRRAHPGQVKGTGGDDDDDGSEQESAATRCVGAELCELTTDEPRRKEVDVRSG